MQSMSSDRSNSRSSSVDMGRHSLIGKLVGTKRCEMSVDCCTPSLCPLDSGEDGPAVKSDLTVHHPHHYPADIATAYSSQRTFHNRAGYPTACHNRSDLLTGCISRA